MLLSDDISQDDIDAYVASIEESAILGRSKRRLRLLTHLIQSEFLGHGDQLKAYSIGLDIFGKPDAFDPATDSVVRVEMGRLRTALALFEASAFSETRIIVEIPTGTYRPNIKLRTPTDASAAPTSVQTLPKGNRLGLAAGAFLFVMAVIAAMFFVSKPDVQPSVDASALGVQLSIANTETGIGSDAKRSLAQALSRSKVFRVFEPTPDWQSGGDAKFELKLSASVLDQTHRASLQLIDLLDMRLVWSTTISENSETALLDSIENKVARELRIRLFSASREFLETLDPKDLSPEALFVLATWTGDGHSAIAWEKTRIDFAKQALTLDPDFGAAHSVLADKLAFLANVYAPADTEENRVAAQFHARKALELSPLDPDVVFNVAQSYWHSGQITQSKATMARVLELDPGHYLARFLERVTPYTCAAAPDEVLAQAKEFDAALLPDNPIRWVTLTWIGWLHAYREEWAPALAAEEAAARIFQVPYTFMRRAMILNKLDRADDALTVILDQNQTWTDFDARHFTFVTVPRLCTEKPESEVFFGYYTDLIDALVGGLMD